MNQSETQQVNALVIERVFDAPREQVWKAWTEPERIARWWGKRGWSTPPSSVTLDLRPGGAFRLNSISEADGREMPLDAVFVEVVEPERLVFARGDQLATVTFADLGDGRTEMWFEQSGEGRIEQYERAKEGWGGFFDRIDERLGTGTES